MVGRLCHWGPLLALSIIITLFLCGLYCTMLWLPPWTSLAGGIHFAVFITWLFLIMNYFLKSIWLGPGYLPLKWRMQVCFAVYVSLQLHFLLCVFPEGYTVRQARKSCINHHSDTELVSGWVFVTSIQVVSNTYNTDWSLIGNKWYKTNW